MDKCTQVNVCRILEPLRGAFVIWKSEKKQVNWHTWKDKCINNDRKCMASSAFSSASKYLSVRPCSQGFINHRLQWFICSNASSAWIRIKPKQRAVRSMHFVRLYLRDIIHSLYEFYLLSSVLLISVGTFVSLCYWWTV